MSNRFIFIKAHFRRNSEKRAYLMENVNYFNNEIERINKYYDNVFAFSNINLYDPNKELRLYNYKFKKTPHYFTIKCRLNPKFEMISSSIKLNEVNKKDFILCKKHISLIYVKRVYNPFSTWFQYWGFAFNYFKNKKSRSKYSIARTRQTLFDLCSCNFVKGHSLFLTLTYDINKKLPSTIYDVSGAFDYDKALTDIKRFVERFKRVFGETMKYVYFIEQQNGKHNNYNFFTGAYHFHILIFNAMYFKQGFKNKDCKENAQKLWGHGIAFVEKIPQRNINNTCKYISKYISKDTLCVDSGSHALHSSKGLKRPLELKFYDMPSLIDNSISLELFDNMGIMTNGFNVGELCPYSLDNNGVYDYKSFLDKKFVLKSRYIDITIMRLPCFDSNGNSFINENCDFLVKVHCDLDYRNNFFKKRCSINV